MNMTTTMERPRLACRMTRAWIAIARSGDASRSSHVENCEECQAHFAADDALTELLQKDAKRQRVEPSATLERDILRGVHEAAFAGAQPKKSSHRFATWSMLGVACGAVAVVAFALLSPSRSTLPEQGGSVARIDPKQLEQVGGVVSKLWNAVTPTAEVLASSENLLAADPLQKEVDAVYADARSAVAFLAMNFLPMDRDSALERLQGANARSAAGG